MALKSTKFKPNSILNLDSLRSPRTKVPNLLEPPHAIPGKSKTDQAKQQVQNLFPKTETKPRQTDMNPPSKPGSSQSPGLADLPEVPALPEFSELNLDFSGLQGLTQGLSTIGSQYQNTFSQINRLQANAGQVPFGLQESLKVQSDDDIARQQRSAEQALRRSLAERGIRPDSPQATRALRQLESDFDGKQIQGRQQAVFQAEELQQNRFGQQLDLLSQQQRALDGFLDTLQTGLQGTQSVFNQNLQLFDRAQEQQQLQLDAWQQQQELVFQQQQQQAEFAHDLQLEELRQQHDLELRQQDEPTLLEYTQEFLPNLGNNPERVLDLLYENPELANSTDLSQWEEFFALLEEGNAN